MNRVASEFVESLGEVFPGYKFRYDAPKEFIGKYYYDFILETLDEKISEVPFVAGGACGFTIELKTEKVEMIVFSELAILEQNEREINDIYNKLKDTKESSKSLSWLKSKYKLSSLELLTIKKIVIKTNLSKEKILEQLNELIQTKGSIP